MLTLTQETITELKETIETELLKRGFTAPITVTSAGSERYPVVEIESEKFQTTPVLFKAIQIDNFGGSIQEETITRNDEEFEVISIWVPVHITYEHFSGGTNGCELFTLTAKVSDNRLHELNIR